MVLYTRNLLVSSALVLSTFSHMAVGMEGEQQEKAPVNLAAWGIASSFVTSLFDPFSQDVQTLGEKGVVQCTLDMLATNNKSKADMTVSLDTILSVEQVIEQAILAGGAVTKDVVEEIIRKGIPVAQAALYPTIALSFELSGLHPVFGLAATSAALALTNPGRKALMYTAGGLVLIYALQHFPGVDGAFTATAGTPFPINANGDVPVSLAISPDGTNLYLATTEGNNPLNIKAIILNTNTDAVTKNITVTTTSDVATYPRVSATENGFFVGWTTNSDVVSSQFYGSNGAANGGIIQDNQVTAYGNGLGQSAVSGSTTQTNSGFQAWSGGDTSGNSYILGCETTSSGPQTKEFIINTSPYNVAGTAPCVTQQGDVVTAGWLNLDPIGFVARSFFPNGTFVSNPVQLNQTGVSGNHVRCAPLENNQIVFGLPVAAGPAARITQNAAPVGSQFSLGSGEVGAEVSLSSCDSGTKFLSAFPGAGTSKDVQLRYFDSSGNSLAQTSISGSNAFYTDVACQSGSTDCTAVWSNKSGTFGAKVSLAGPKTPAPTVVPTSVPTHTPAPAPAPTSAASGLASSFVMSVASTVTASYLSWYYGSN